MATSGTAGLTGLSLFSSAGIGDLALRGLGVEILVANELLDQRADLFRTNHPDTAMVVGDVREVGDEVSRRLEEALDGRSLDLVLATPPCQGMSRNGRGKLLRGVRDGLRDAIDPRNQLATLVPTFVARHRPRAVVYENVPEMLGTLVEDASGRLVELVDHLADLTPGYAMRHEVVEFADHGVPQRRQRLLTVFVREDVADAVPAPWLASPTHGRDGRPEPWVTVAEALAGVPPLDAGSDATRAHRDLALHRVPRLDERKHWWVRHTPAEGSAFDNQCVEPGCGHRGTPGHGSARTRGVNRARRDTPIHCDACGALLPRPSVETDAGPRLMKGFTSAYKRMSADLPASALTKNLSYACSDQKLHPTEHRVLSLHEAGILHTLDRYDWQWRRASGRRVSDKQIREAIGESIPPLGLERVLRPLVTALSSLAAHEHREHAA